MKRAIRVNRPVRWGVLAAMVVAGVATFLPLAQGRIKLITLPVRERVEIQLDNPDATLVEVNPLVLTAEGLRTLEANGYRLPPGALICSYRHFNLGKEGWVELLVIRRGP